MSDARRSVLIICTAVSAWGTIGDWRVASCVLVALCALAPWKDDA